MRTCACVDCGTTILGERLRCPRCHDDHALQLAPALAPPRSTWVAVAAPLLFLLLVTLAIVGAAYL